jgi:hypothetical protein
MRHEECRKTFGTPGIDRIWQFFFSVEIITTVCFMYYRLIFICDQISVCCLSIYILDKFLFF